MESEIVRSKALIDLEESVYTALETYSNVHRGTGYNSTVTTALYEKAREIILDYLDLDRDEYVVIFTTPLRLKRFKNTLQETSFHILSSKNIGLPLGIRAIAAKLKDLKKVALFHTGGGMIKHVAAKSVVWAEIPEKFEAGTPNIINVIAFAKALLIKKYTGYDFTKEQKSRNLSLEKILYSDDLSKYTGEDLLLKLREQLVGYGLLIPTVEGKSSYVNFDNAASTPTFRPIWDAFRLTLNQSREMQQKIVQEVKKICEEFLQAPLDLYNVIFTSNTTEAINIAAQNFSLAFARSTKPVILNTKLEHHSNELPWRFIPGASLIRNPIDNHGFIHLKKLEHLLQDYNKFHKHGKKRIKVVAICGASNVLGSFNNLKAISRITHRYGAHLLVDAAQLVGHRSVKLAEIDIDYFAFAGHKLYAPFGAGVLIAKKELLKFSPSELKAIKLSGEENVAGIAAMGKALLLLKRIGMNIIENYERKLTKIALEGLNTIEDIEIFGLQHTQSPKFNRKGGIVAFSMKKVPHNLVAKELTEIGGIGIRNGCFCAHILIRQLLKINFFRTYGSILLAMLLPEMTDMILPGIIRMSFGIENNEKEVKHFIQILKQISHKPRTLGQKAVARFHNGVLFSRNTKTQYKIEKSIEVLMKK
ncbi:MAG: aminotransferase class V-fold PLP-dependent enzyme, partial [Candidatus Hodarchaeota archaeon]